MRKFELALSDFEFDFHKRYDQYGLIVFLERKGLRPAPTPYHLWLFIVVASAEIIDSGPFRWSTIIRERLRDEDVADILVQFYAGTTKISKLKIVD